MLAFGTRVTYVDVVLGCFYGIVYWVVVASVYAFVLG